MMPLMSPGELLGLAQFSSDLLDQTQ